MACYGEAMWGGVWQGFGEVRQGLTLNKGANNV